MNLDGNQDLRWPRSLLSWQKACHSSPSPSRVQQLSPSLLTLSEAHPGSYVDPRIDSDPPKLTYHKQEYTSTGSETSLLGSACPGHTCPLLNAPGGLH